MLLRHRVVSAVRHSPSPHDGASVSWLQPLIVCVVMLCRSLSVLLFTCICGLMMNDVLRIDTVSGSSASLTSEDELKNTAFGIFTLILNFVALFFIIYTVAPEYRFIKRLIATIKNVSSRHDCSRSAFAVDSCPFLFAGAHCAAGVSWVH